MNDSYFNLPFYNNENEKRHTMCQEVAHTFGLGHQSVDGTSQDSCMDYFGNVGINKDSTKSTKPNAHDFEELKSIYAGKDKSPTQGGRVPFLTQESFNENPKSWGNFMQAESSGVSGYYEINHKDGSRTISHVYWDPDYIKDCEYCDHRDDHHE